MPGPVFAPSPHVGVSCDRCGLEVALLPNGDYRCHTPDCRERSQIFTPIDPMNLAAYGASRPHEGAPPSRPGERPWVGKAKGRKRK